MTVYDVAYSESSPGVLTAGSQVWAAQGAHLDRLRNITRDGEQMKVLGNALQNGDRVMAWDTDAAGANKGVWRAHAAASNFIYTEIGRWNDTGADYRTAGDADYTNFSGASWCANRAPLNNVADPFPLNSATTYRLRYVPGGGATQAAAEVIGTPTQAHIDSSPGGGIWCGRFGVIADMTAAFGNPESNPNSPARFNGGQWILDLQSIAPTYSAVSTWNIGASGNSGEADYWQGSGDSGTYRTGFFVNVVSASGQNITSVIIGSDTYRLRVVGGTLDGREAVGTLTIEQPDNAGRRAIRIGTGAEMRAAFGNANIGSGGGVLYLERQD